ncbi:MAG: hypothetical protein LBK61_14570 [Spirochaetaceae bacterium]|jgi:hypothetical protein|nr:hypothetical protein [Spirochaetaceae bacterium]
MQKRKTASGMARLLLALAAATAILLVGIGCPTSSDEGTPNYGEGGLAPERPYTIRVDSGFELVNVDLKTVTEQQANADANQSATIAFTWGGEGALSYKVYMGDEPSWPQPLVASTTSPVYFARNLAPLKEYYFWIEAVNENGSTMSDVFSKTTGKKGPEKNKAGGVERADFLKKIRIVPGSGSLTVSWDLVDRVAWFEVYYVPKTGTGSIKHLDAYTPLVFKYDANPSGEPTPGHTVIDISGLTNASSVAYKAGTSDNRTGYTVPVYSYMSPLAGNNGQTGYYVRDGATAVHTDTRPVIGVNTLSGTFYKVFEAYDQGIQDPYKPLDAAFASAIPWDGEKGIAGAPGTPVKFFGTSTTITGLTDGTEYEVWIRSPNANGERAYTYAVGTPGASAVLPAVAGVTVNAPANEFGTLQASWSAVPDAEKYRIYASQYSYTPDVFANYTEVDGNALTGKVTGLKTATSYNVWVVAVKGGVAGAFGTSASGTTISAPSTGHQGTKVIVGTDKQVKTAVYIEVNDDNPLNAGSYILEDGTYLFDYVILFAANIRNRTPCDDGCSKTGVHVHLNPNVQAILSDKAKYIKPLQDKGMKVLLGLLGDHDGISFSSLNDTDRKTFIDDLKQTVELYNLDGVDFDDEWGSKEDWDGWGNGLPTGNPAKTYNTVSPNSIWTYPETIWGYPTKVTVYRNPGTGFGTGIEGIKTGNGTLTAPADNLMEAMWKASGEAYYKTIIAARTALPKPKIVSLYEFNTGRYITAGGTANVTATKENLQNAIDFALQPWYDQYRANSANGLSRTIYSPFGMDLSGEAYTSQNGAPNPPIVVNGNEKGDGTIYRYATDFMEAASKDEGPYGMLYFYALEPARDRLKYVSTDSSASVTKEDYMSRMTTIVFGKRVVLTAEGGNYSKDW